MGYLIFFALVGLAIFAYTKRVQILAKVLGQPERRIERRLNDPRK